MKILFKTSLLLITLLSLTFYSCVDTETDSDDETPTAGECMDFVKIDNDYSELIHLDFIDDNNGWAIGKKSAASHDLLNTSDAGVTWQVINENFEMDFDNGYTKGEALKFINATHGFKNVTDYNEEVLEIQYTTDKGATWNTFVNPFSISGTYTYVDWWNETFVSNGSETLFFGRNYYNTFVLKVDNDMNIIYSQMYDNDDYPVRLEDISAGTYHYATDGTITAVVTLTGDYSGDEKIAQSTDNGTTWTIITDISGFTSSSWVNDTVGYICAGNYGRDIYKTLDGGATWSILNEAPKFEMIRFADADNGIGVTDFGFYYTTDGGNSWTEIDVCKDSDGRYIMGYDEVIAYPSVNNGWVAGSNYHADLSGTDEGIFHFTGE